MAEPSKKHPAVERIITRIFGDRQPCIRANVCRSCNGLALEFKTERAKKEFTISGWCQDCQDQIFTQEEV